MLRKRMYFFGFIPPKMKIRKKRKSHFLCRIFFFIQIAYIILSKKKKVLFKIPLILLKTLKNRSFMNFFRKKVYCHNTQCFLFNFDENNEIRRKSSKNSLFWWKEVFFVKWHILFFSELKKDGLSQKRC